MRTGLRKRTVILWLLIVLVTPVAAYYLVHRREPLSTFSRPEGWDNGGDTSLVSNYRFTDQLGRSVSLRSFPGKILVVNFFFSRCISICPRMMAGLGKAAEAYRQDPEVHFLSFTVDPEYDDQARLAGYAKHLGARTPQWELITGEKRKIYRLARTGFRVDAAEGDGGAYDFIHSDKVVLMDAHGNIRGYYSGIVPGEMDQLISDIQKLEAENGHN
ncbi:SCO family protein [Compostibacter hankyongensis]|uniref:Thioredoxin domain-containing protein n=1 Tax=Compostibacter hankyongensis TaxID=1007089 RepID=A0ABP8FWL0_9BACT